MSKKHWNFRCYLNITFTQLKNYNYNGIILVPDCISSFILAILIGSELQRIYLHLEVPSFGSFGELLQVWAIPVVQGQMEMPVTGH